MSVFTMRFFCFFTALFLFASGVCADTWLTQALALQREMDSDVPLKYATFIGTHNSYNASAYQIPLVRYLDPNQSLSLFDQLETGIRSLELDVHWTLGRKFRKEILLCHGQSNHLGCSPFDRPLKEGLIEIRNWLIQNPGEIILLYIERHLDDHDWQLIQQLENYLGPFIYRTSYTKHHGTCLALPTLLSKTDIKRANKQLIIVTKTCKGLEGRGNDLIFTGIGEIENIPYSFLDATVTHFEPYPGCSRTTLFSSDKLHSSLWRIFEDRTVLGGILEPQKKLLSHEMRQLMRCGINWPTMDNLLKNDVRLEAAIWSWARSYPQASLGHCAYYHHSKGIKNQTCYDVQPGFACADNNNAIQVAAVAGRFADGEVLCRNTFGKTFHFTTPINGSEMDMLNIAMEKVGLKTLWINYALDQQGKWHAHPLITRNKAVA